MIKYKATPELTNIGSFEKCWKKINGEWWLYKQGNANELFSELFVYELGMALGFPMAEYELDGNYIRSRDFTKAASVNFDNNIALIARGYPTNLMREKDKLIELFMTFLEGNPLALEYFENLQHPEITDSLLTACFNRIPIEINRSVITQFILNGKTQIQMILEQKMKKENIQQTFGG